MREPTLRRPVALMYIAALLVVACVGKGSAAGSTGGGAGAADSLAVLAEYGVTLALSGEYEAAERAFIGLLARSPGDARALNNLGNLHLLRGAPDLASAFYGRALEADSADAGIRLNRSVALMRAGKNDLALTQAGIAIRRAGGPESAASLLGLRQDEIESKASETEVDGTLSRSQIRALLEDAASAVPEAAQPAASADSSGSREEAGTGSGTETRDSGRRMWRSAGPRADDGTGIMLNLYWKR